MPGGRHALVGVTQRLEQSGSLDGLRSFYTSVAGELDRWSGSELLRAGLVGHALHPLLTDLPLGFWTAATALDLRGRATDRGASRWLVGAGLAASAPTALTGLAELARVDDRAAQRVGALHGSLNGLASTLYVASFVARSRRHHTLGVATALAGAAVTGVSGYLGGHLSLARKVGSRHPAYATDAVGPPDPWGSPPVTGPAQPVEPVGGPGAMT